MLPNNKRRSVGVMWEYVAFSDNCDRIELLTSILSALNDESRLAKANDDGFAHRVFEVQSSHNSKA